MKLHHIGIVVDKIEDSVGELKHYLNFQTVSMPLPVLSQKVNVCFLKAGESFLELIEPVSSDSPISEFARSGGGFHHLCFEVDDIHKELEALTKKGASVLVEPVKGFDERLIAFVDLKTDKTRSGLVELLERK